MSDMANGSTNDHRKHDPLLGRLTRSSQKRLFRKRYSKPGSAPGRFEPPQDQPTSDPAVDVLVYDADSVEEKRSVSLADAFDLVRDEAVTWINIVGHGDGRLIKEVGERLGIHPLALEDVMNVPQRPKVEHYPEYEFIVLQMVEWKNGVDTEQLSLFVTQRMVVTVQMKAGDPFVGVRERIRSGTQIRTRGSDYLAYALMDAVVDHYFPVLEAMANHLEDLEDRVLQVPTEELLHALHNMKRELIYLRRAVWPLREVVGTIARNETLRLSEITSVYVRDLYDHVLQVLDHIESYAEFASDLRDLYLSRASQRLNEITKVLTIIATIFIPLTFVAGVYGMNFNPASGPLNMPELGWRWGYPAVWIVMLVIAGGMIVYFRRKKWL